MGQGELPRSRHQRAAQVAKLAAAEAVKQAGTRTANLARSQEARRIAAERRHLDAAEQVINVLGFMKGAAMKIGQILSVLDLGVLPEESREEIQRKLAILQAQAPEVPFDRMRRVIEQDLGAPVRELFADLDPEPLGAASIGQVYHGALQDGREVAVKVQYPGIATAVRADMKNLSLLMRVVRPLAPGVDLDAIAAEIRNRVTEELDYRLEAASQREAWHRFEGHPFVVIPSVHEELCARRVLVTDYVEGAGFDEVRDGGRKDRDRLGEAVFRFYSGSIYRLGEFSGDPHPGNFLALADGRVAFIDFGLYKRMRPAAVRLEIECQAAAAEGRIHDLHRLMGEAGILADVDAPSPEELAEYIDNAVGWYLRDEELEITPEFATETFIHSIDATAPTASKVRSQSIPAEHLISRRNDILVLAALGQLHARANWHRIAREWLFGDEPATELGALEAEFYAARAGGRPDARAPA